jgi:hypothetical protein
MGEDTASAFEIPDFQFSTSNFKTISFWNSFLYSTEYLLRFSEIVPQFCLVPLPVSLHLISSTPICRLQGFARRLSELERAQLKAEIALTLPLLHILSVSLLD